MVIHALADTYWRPWPSDMRMPFNSTTFWGAAVEPLAEYRLVLGLDIGIILATIPADCASITSFPAACIDWFLVSFIVLFPVFPWMWNNYITRSDVMQ